jgi:3-oxoacyl-[acyl-carrier-protein] synthase-3
MTESHRQSESHYRKIVIESVRRAMRTSREIPPDDEDLISSGALDSMGWVAALESIEEAAGVRDLADPSEGGGPCSISTLIASLHASLAGIPAGDKEEAPLADQHAPPMAGSFSPVEISGWGAALGSVRVEVAALEREYNLAPGTLRERAGIESVARADKDENELSLAASAAEAALRVASSSIDDVDCLIATSETFVGFPSFGSLLHTRLLARGNCGVLDVGGACLGLLNALSVANSVLSAGAASRVLITTAEVHSRRLAPGCVAGEFGGLFGDGASAFVMSRAAGTSRGRRYRVRDFQFGCAGSASSALAVGMRANGQVSLEFRGEALARAALARLEKIISALELRTGFSRCTAGSFATHQPNPRIVEMLARQANLPLEKFPVVSRIFGNLGSSTCGVALSLALGELTRKPTESRGPIFLAAVGPGMLWGGGVLC